MKLVIAEKPSVAKSIASVLGAEDKKNGYLQGNGYIVSWCVGHLIELAQAGDYKEEWQKWSYESLPIIPNVWRHCVKEHTKEQYEVLFRLLHLEAVSEVICATDAGREGELIFRLVYDMAGCKKPMKRLWISSMEEKAIAEGFQNLRNSKEYDTLYQSALCRAEADWIVGINATRLFSTLYRKKLNIGRVQTPTLALLVNREKDISDFQKETYYMAHILFDGGSATTQRINQKEEAEEIRRACQNRQAFVVSVEEEEKVVNPPKLYDLITLQREANRLFGYTAQQTLDYTQSLYEKKLVTYPRTDSKFLTDDMGSTVETVIAAVVNTFSFAKDSVFMPNIEKVLNSKKVSDHHAIIPTMEILKMRQETIPKVEYNLLCLVANRLLCAVAEKQILHTVKAILECNQVLFYAGGKSITKNGWKGMEETFQRSFQVMKEKEKEESILPVLEQGMVLDQVESRVSEHVTAPPKHFTEDTLLSAMERAGTKEITEDVERMGLGTSATRAAIIEKLIATGFVERKNKTLLPTPDGNQLIAIVPQRVKSAKMTAGWENKLTLIAKGEESRESFMEEIREMIVSLVKDESIREASENAVFRNEQERETIGKCPKCGSMVVESKVNFYCENKGCYFSLFKNNKYFASMKKELSKSIAKDLLTKGKAKVSGLYSAKKGTTFSAIIVLDATDTYPRFSMEFDTKKRGGK